MYRIDLHSMINKADHAISTQCLGAVFLSPKSNYNFSHFLILKKLTVDSMAHTSQQLHISFIISVCTKKQHLFFSSKKVLHIFLRLQYVTYSMTGWCKQSVTCLSLTLKLICSGKVTKLLPAPSVICLRCLGLFSG